VAAFAVDEAEEASTQISAQAGGGDFDECKASRYTDKNKMTINNMELTFRVKNGLRLAGLDTTEKIAQAIEDGSIRFIKNIGKVSISEIKEELERVNGSGVADRSADAEDALARFENLIDQDLDIGKLYFASARKKLITEGRWSIDTNKNKMAELLDMSVGTFLGLKLRRWMIRIGIIKTAFIKQ
jgi:Bacterial RNA polymerase, alpha chain C terminal domain